MDYSRTESDSDLIRHLHSEYSLSDISISTPITYTNICGFECVIMPTYPKQIIVVERKTYKQKIRKMSKKIKKGIVMSGCVCYGIGAYAYHIILH